MKLLIVLLLVSLPLHAATIAERFDALKFPRMAMHEEGITSSNMALFRKKLIRKGNESLMARLEAASAATEVSEKAKKSAKVGERSGTMALKQKLKLTEPDLTPNQIKRLFKYLLRNLK